MASDLAVVAPTGDPMFRPSTFFAVPVALGLFGSSVLFWGNEAAATDAPGQVAAATQAQPSSKTRSTVIKEVLPSSVRIAWTRDGTTLRTASGVILSFENKEQGRVGYVMTNAHVVHADKQVEGAKLEILVDRKGKTTRFAGRVVAEGKVPDLDLAVIEVPNLEGRAARLADDLELGDDVVAVGAPYGKGLSVSSGIVSQLEWDDSGDTQAFKTDAPIGYGASGGGIFRVPDGKLLAVIEGYRTAKVSLPVAEVSYSFDVPMPGETFAAPAGKIRGFLKAHGLERLLAAPTAAAAGGATASR